MKPLIYVSSPVTSYQSPLYEANLKLIAARWPTAEIIAARDHYKSNQDWLARWPTEHKQYSGCVFFSYEGVVGKGVVTELKDLDANNTPILYLTCESRIEGNFIPYHKVSIQLLNDGKNWTNYARVVVL